LSDLYDAEQQLMTALPTVSKAAHSLELRQALDEHLEQTRNHVTRLDDVFGRLGVARTPERCAAMSGIIHEGDKIASADGDPRHATRR
jgi:ferritin-like metal-binding protein YciE